MAKTDTAIKMIETTDSAAFAPLRQALIDFNEAVLKVSRKTGHLIAYDDGNPVGGIAYRYYGPDAFIDYLSVIEPHRKNGIGSRLMLDLEKLLKKVGCQRIMVDTDAFQAPGFYKRLGYEQTGITPNRLGGYDRISFCKQLTPVDNERT